SVICASSAIDVRMDRTTRVSDRRRQVGSSARKVFKFSAHAKRIRVAAVRLDPLVRCLTWHSLCRKAQSAACLQPQPKGASVELQVRIERNPNGSHHVALAGGHAHSKSGGLWLEGCSGL